MHDFFENMDKMNRALVRFLYSNYPEFNPTDLGYFAKQLFKDEIASDKKKFVEFGVSKALYSSLEFYAKKFVEFGVSKASSSRFEFYADLVRWLMSRLRCVIQVLGQALFSILEFYAKKMPKHRHRRRAKKKVRKWRRRALLVLIWDTGASAGLTSFRSDFIDYVEVDFEDVFNNPNSEKSDIVRVIKKYVPDFEHIETGKHLDQKM